MGRGILPGTRVDGTRHPATIGTEVGTKLHHRERLPEGKAADCALGASGTGHERLSPSPQGEEVDDEGGVGVFHCSQHNASDGFLHGRMED